MTAEHNGPTRAFLLRWPADEPLYRAVLAYAADCLVRVPALPEVVLGRSVIEAVRRWCVDGYASSGSRDLTQLDLALLGSGGGPATEVLVAMRDDVGDFAAVDPAEVGASLQEHLDGEDVVALLNQARRRGRGGWQR